MINARIETILEKPSFKKAVKTQRCIVPSTGFYEWKKDNDTKTPYYIHPKNDRYMAFAGIYDTWQAENGAMLKTFSIITTDATQEMANIHHRMPVILDTNDEQRWLSEPQKGLEALIGDIRVPHVKLEMYPVSKLVNTPAREH